MRRSVLSMKWIYAFAITAVAMIVGAAPVRAADVRAYFFYGDGCPHCAKEQYFLETLKDRHPSLSVYEFEVYNHPENVERLIKTAEALRIVVDGVPFLVIGDQMFSGYAPGTTDRAIEQRVETCKASACPDSIAQILGVAAPRPLGSPSPGNGDAVSGMLRDALLETPEETAGADLPVVPDAGSASSAGGVASSFTVPIIGSFDARSISLPFLTVVMGLLDGFNPCAMWTLLFLISLLLGMGDRRKMWILGGAFIAASSAVYLLFMVAWLKLILFLGFITWIRIAIGGVALVGGAYSIRSFFTNRDGGCEVVGEEGRRKTFERMRSIVRQGNLWFALGGIIALAFAVNTVELVCSAGFPAVYTQVLALRNLVAWQYGAYILLYIFFFMLDDLFVFVVTMATLEMTGVTTRYVRASRMIGGLLLTAIGLILIFKPAWLMF